MMSSLHFGTLVRDNIMQIGDLVSEILVRVENSGPLAASVLGSDADAVESMVK